MEALGVLDRQKVAEEVKGLEQPARATLRKHGVRFGAYHIHLPALLKPAPRVLATQLWALKHGGTEKKGLEAIEQLAASGRTSIATDEEIAKALYRIAGYRVCGARAVRVDILERLADLIRPALAWRSGGAGVKPPGATEGFGFTVTAGMTSLAGCSGENFASVLRSLGYRMEKRPKPPEAAPAPAEATAQSSHSAQEITAEASLNGQSDAPAAAFQGAESAEVSVGSVEAGTADAPPLADATMDAAASEPNALIAQSAEQPRAAEEAPTLASPAQAEGPAGDVAGSAPPPQAAAKPELAAEEFIEIWRPGPAPRDEHARKAGRERRPRQRRPHREPQRPPVSAEPAAAVSAENGVAPAASAQQDAHSEHPGQPDRPERRRDAPRPARHTPRPKRAGRPQGDDERSPRGDRGGRAPRGDRPDRDPALRAKYIKGRGGSGERREPDPNSPFAKLAALKEQLEASNKEPR
jgi:ATP-dependent RNA helicase SUPV3L1/SUV3